MGSGSPMACASTVPPCALGTSADRRPQPSCAANAFVEPDGLGNRMFNKKRSRGRIDGMVTITMAVGGATANEKPKKKSVYASRGVIRL